MANFATTMAAGFQGQQLTEELLRKQLQNQGTRNELMTAQRQREAQAVVAQALQQALGGQGAAPMPGMPKPFTPARVPAMAPATTEGTTMPTGGAPLQSGGVSQQGAVMPSGGAPQTSQQMTPPEPMAPQPPAQKPFSYRQVMEEISRRSDIDPETRFLATQEIQKQVDMEDARNEKARLTKEAAADRLYRDLTTLEARYRMAGNNEVERIALTKEYDLKLQQLRNLGNETTATIGANSRERIADKNNNRALQIADANIGSRERVASWANELKKSLGEGKLDLDATKLDRDTVYRERVLDLREKGMSLQDAQFYAKLDQTRALNLMRDETTRRGQDLISKDKGLALQGKIDAKRASAATGVDEFNASADAAITDIERLLANQEGLENATGPIDSRLPTFREQTAVFETDLKGLKDKIALAAMAKLKAMSATGSSGLGSVSNFEQQMLQNSLAALDAAQTSESMRAALLRTMDALNGARNRLTQAYERQYATSPAGGAVPTTTTNPKPGGETRAVPANLANEPDGTVVKNGGKTFTKQGNKLVETGS